MGSELYPFVLFIILLFAWITFPLIPAWITFKITPSQTLGLRGPLQGMTVRATGAFAAYLIIFVVFATYLKDGMTIIGALTHPAWRLNAEVKLLDPNDKPRSIPHGKRISVTLDPDLHRTLASNRIQLRLADDPSTWPYVILQIPSLGGSDSIDLSGLKESDMDIDHLRKTIMLKNPIVLREFPATGFGLAQPAPLQ